MPKVYTYKDYNKYLCLKVDSGLWLVVLFLLRPYILLVSTIRIGRGGSGAKGAEGLKDLVYPDQLALGLGMIATVPVIVFIYAWIKRAPGASALVRSIWGRGKLMLASSALLGALAVIVPYLAGYARQIQAIGWSQIGLSLIIVVYLYHSERVKDTFDDFPEVMESDEDRSRKQG